MALLRIFIRILFFMFGKSPVVTKKFMTQLTDKEQINEQINLMW